MNIKSYFVKTLYKYFVQSILSYLKVIALLTFLILCLVTISGDCNLPTHLGKGYRLNYSKSKGVQLYYRNYCGFGRKIQVLEASLFSCGYNKKWITIKTKDKQYYLLDKSIKYSPARHSDIVLGPRDSISFYSSRDSLNIHFDLIIIKQLDF